MSDPRTILERAARRIDPRSDAFERLERRRERKARNRRITAGAVALLVAIGGSYAAFSVFRDSNGTITGAGDSGFHALWPEVTLADAQAVQERLDAGDPDPGWRLDAATVAGFYAHQALGWDGYSVQPVDGADPSGPGGVEMSVQHVSPDQALASASPVPACFPPAGGCSVTVTAERQDSVVVVLDRLVNPDGIWSVVEVYDPTLSLRLPISPGATVVSGQEFLIPFQVPDGFQAEVGYGYVAPDCGGGVFTNYSSSGNAAHLFEVGQDGIRFSVADMSFEQSCEPGQSGSIGGGMDLPNGASLNVPLDGYVFIALQPTGAGEDDPFDASLPNVIANAPVAVAGVPVHFVPVSEASSTTTEPLPSVAQVTCSDAGTQVSTPVVQPQPDGVHIAIDNSTGMDLGLQIENFGGDNAPTGTSEIVRQIPPGVYRLACVDVRQPNLAPIDYQPFEVQDPASIWVPTDLTGCTSASGIAGSSASSSGGIPPGVHGTPVEVVTTTISGLLPTDVVEAAGYTSATDEATVRVVRDGNIVATYHLFPDDKGGWTIDSAQACDGTNLASLGVQPGGTVSAFLCPPTGGGTPPSTDLAIVARGMTFDPTCLVVPAGEPLTIRLDNEDSGVPKNIAIYPMDGCLEARLSTGDPLPTCRALAHPVFRGDVVAILGGPTYQVPALDAGRYWFQDDVHPNSYGLLIVE